MAYYTTSSKAYWARRREEERRTKEAKARREAEVKERLERFRAFEAEHGKAWVCEDTGRVETYYETCELANRAAELWREYWGSNLVITGLEQVGPGYQPRYNLWD